MFQIVLSKISRGKVMHKINLDYCSLEVALFPSLDVVSMLTRGTNCFYC